MTTTHLKKRIKLPLWQVVRFHLSVELSLLRNVQLIPSDLDLLTLLVQSGQQPLPDFCAFAARVFNPECPDGQLATRTQNIRNRLVKLEKKSLVLKSKPGKQTMVEVVPMLRIALDKPILLDYQFLSKNDTEQVS